ncbi:MAG: hypothetical protein MJZ12_07060 [Prevotella sp.]|nr:hypothetical protein [Prevotella sp.]
MSDTMSEIKITNNYNAPIGQKIDHVDKIEAHFDKGMGMHVSMAEEITPDVAATGNDSVAHAEPQEELFHFIHPEIEESEEVKVHQQVKRLVGRFGMQDICKYLNELARERRILLPQSAQNAYDELIRMGMPNEEGFAFKTFTKYYKK